MRTIRRPSVRSTVLSGTAALALLLTWACAGGPGPGNATQNFMRGHFEAASRIQMAILRGDLQAARPAAEAIWAVDRLPDMGLESIAYVRAVQDRAREIRDAGIYGEAAVATGRLAAACGACHVAFDGGPRISYQQPPPEGEGFGRHMVRHVWAADRLWEGLLAPSDEAWRLGAELMAEDDMATTRLSSAAERHAVRLRELAREAVETSDPEARGVLYGRILSTCGACHAEAPGS